VDEYQILALLMRLDSRNLDADRITSLFVETLANASERLTDDEIRRFLMCGAFLFRSSRLRCRDHADDANAASGSRLIDVSFEEIIRH
jgi:hypothetical protein